MLGATPRSFTGIPGEHASVNSFRGYIRMYPRSGFRSGGTSATLLATPEFQGRKKPININNFVGLSRKWVGVTFEIVYVFPFFLGKKVKHINKIPRKSQEKPGESRESPGITPGQTREIFVYVFSCLLVFFFPALLWLVNLLSGPPGPASAKGVSRNLQAPASLETVSQQSRNCLFSEVSKRGWREGVGDQQSPKYSKNRRPELHRKKCAEKRPESPTPFRNL